MSAKEEDGVVGEEAGGDEESGEEGEAEVKVDVVSNGEMGVGVEVEVEACGVCMAISSS